MTFLVVNFIRELMQISDKPSLQYIKRILSYNPVTGDLLWKWRADRKTNWNTRWSGQIAGAVNKPSKKKDYSRRVLNVEGQMIKAHHIVWLMNTGEWPVQEIDHIDRDPLNNRFENLRLSDRREQALNTGLRGDNKSGVKGVSFDKKDGRYKAEICEGGKNKFLGYGTLEECTELRREAERRNYDKKDDEDSRD